PAEPLCQGLLPERQQVCVLLCRRLALGAGDEDGAGHGADAGRPSRRRAGRVEEGGRPGRESRAEKVEMSPPDTVPLEALAPQPPDSDFPEFLSIPNRNPRE